MLYCQAPMSDDHFRTLLLVPELCPHHQKQPLTMPKLTCMLPSTPFYLKLTTEDVGRRLEGERLAGIVARDLAKKERSTTANRDPHLELNLCDKKLGETGFNLVCGIKEPSTPKTEGHILMILASRFPFFRHRKPCYQT